ncbi:non-hydrolyzing UDP-N-acetylglucosamine 2-epimerase [Salegentibacter salarius]|uniref:non-hydrolyzing UDP-N-acetylglucosamine 2-epimerase n=1 Tax=Salegentibacter salarius TaxID=435906 RepID=UPI0009CBE92B|nr:UDP-N-acetylglucosamine 2-epimerase (non-hydrolyzing) [Salegentibacter salarius]SLJ90835.1 UDP-N-acetylglucosamine 2-epimerase (non-hydrolysing) [Salegentibacter salarius]
MKLLLCFGTRPEAIKMAPIIHECKRRNISFKVCVTAQHREMLDQVLDFFEIQPDYDLNLMKAGQSLNSLSAAIFNKFDQVLELEQPDLLLVHGDTTTASMISQVAFHRQIKIGHVEAGLRTYNKSSPFPEEINRQIIGKIADFHFVPTINAKNNLLSEQVPLEQIILTGNSVVDALEWAGVKIERIGLPQEIHNIQTCLDPKKKLILITGHRRENFGKGLEEICEALLELSQNTDIELVFPMHLNPKVTSTVEKTLKDKPNIHLIAPVSYPSLLWLMKKSIFIISDSGGIQEEAPAFGKPVIVTRNVSERMEGVEAGFSFLTGTSKTKILKEANQIIGQPPNFEGKKNPYGDGKAAQRIVAFLASLARSSSNE